MWGFFFFSTCVSVCAHKNSHPECPCDWSGAMEEGGRLTSDLFVLCALCGGSADHASAFSSDGYKCNE